MALTEVSWIVLLAFTALSFRTIKNRPSFPITSKDELTHGSSTKEVTSQRLTRILIFTLAISGLSLAAYGAIWTLLHSNGDDDESYAVLGAWERAAGWVGYRLSD